ncbi:uncharacterized protein LOC124160671 [Ischnura elegans]|uniref:uncharacterized protein LOC124160671 n=1 Tax=Ischnura elegans TaxID=197161 RepID=UPI001ED8A0E5|nr:uncharacterized protein LOC124160671 [Ischnura elegans]
MCPPPLICPLCASAGGFSSPGALWLGLIGVANRLLSCPVCHELLLGLDKLTIHLVSHVPDLNLLASSIGNHLDISPKTNDASIETHSCSMKDDSINFSARNVSTTRKKQFISRMNSKIKEITSPQDSSINSNFTDVSVSNVKDSSNMKGSFFSQEIDLGRPCFDLEERNINPNTTTLPVLQSRTLLPPSNFQEKHEIISDIRKDEISSERLAFTSVHKDAKENILMDISSSRMSRKIGEKEVTEITATTISQNLTEKIEEHFIKDSNNSGCPTPSSPQPPKKAIHIPNSSHGQTSPQMQAISDKWMHYEKQYLDLGDNKPQCETDIVKTRCDTCQVNFNDPKCLQLHCVLVHPSEDVFNSSFDENTLESLSNFPCHLCNRKLTSNSDLLVHMRFAHSIMPGSSTSDGMERTANSAEFSKNCKLQTSLVSQESESRSNPVEMMHSKLNKGVEGKSRLLSDELEEEIGTKKVEQLESIDDKQNNSNDSHRTTDNENSLDTTKEEYSNGSPAQKYAMEDEMKHACKICEAQFGSIMELIAHRPAHVEENGCICVVCGKSFKKEQHLQQHLRTHEGKQWECDVCSKFFTTKYFLKKHKRLHTGEMPYSCETCGKTFTFQQSYHKHLLYHSDEKPHACNECGKRFKELSTLHNHERIHTGEKPFTCESCGKAFRQRVSYLVHRRIHTGVMPYKCTACDKSFRYKVSQRTHKCSSQQIGTVVRQSSDLVERLLSHQKDKSIVNPGTSKTADATFSDAKYDQSPISNKKDENLEKLPEFSLQTIRREKKKDSYNLDSTSIQSDSLITSNDSQNANSSFLQQISSNLSANDCYQKKSICNFPSSLASDSGEIPENAFNFKPAPEKEDTGEKGSHFDAVSSANRDVGTALSELMGHSNADCHSSFVFNCESTSKVQHVPDLYDSKIDGKEAATQGNNSQLCEEYAVPEFSDPQHNLLHSQSDFFALVMPPTDPGLEKLGKLSISSVQSQEKSNSGQNVLCDQNLGEGLRTTDVSKDVNIPPPVIQKCYDGHGISSKSGFIETEHCQALSRDQDGTANASDLSSFLQSCLEQWHPSNFISNEKDKTGTQTQDTQQSDTNGMNPNPTDEGDNRLHTINEESLRRLLYGDSVP